ncbi:MAG: prepilin-type N-terminal cleavage/methylation domain-containing protein [Candidatus Dactylopiibacterium sp.]|nr:prepilin-type N-terminal cleavage/methylation domain-containing protein [Candidatus Dactylopiibacterium sp.]
MSVERRRAQRGLTLVELVVFIVVVSVGLAGVLGVINRTALASVNPMLVKQQIAIAEALLEEVSGKAFTWCDPDDAKVLEATSAAGCNVAQGLAATPGESRYSSTTPFDNVGDYAGFSMNGIRNPADNSVIAGLSGYVASVAVVQAGSALGLADNSAALRIDVTVTAPDNTAITLTGYRSRHAPNSP